MAYYHEVYNDVLNKLRANNEVEKISKCFEACKNDIDKIQIVDQLKRNGHFQLLRNVQLMTQKNNKESTNARKLGNNHFVANTNADKLKALKCYNKSICYAENNSEELSLGYANRSAVYFALRLYDDCLENIKLAREHSYPARLMAKLNDRENNCLKLRKKEKKVPLPPRPKLSVPGSYKNSTSLVADCLQLKRNEQYGRYVITTENLKVGDVVAIDEAFCSTLPKTYQFERCQNCMDEHNYNLIPCKNCTSAMFCGKTCYDEAYTKFHKFECPIIGYIEKMFCEDVTATLRTVVCAVTAFDSIDELVAFVQECKGLDMTIFNCKFKEKSKNLYGPVHGYTERRYNPFEEFVCCMISSLIYQPLLEHTELKKMCTTAETVSTLKELAFHTSKTMTINRSKSILLDGRLLKNFATGAYPFRSMLNHSCAQNMMITSFQKTMVFTVARPIKAGEQLFDNYDKHFLFDPLVDRQKSFRNFTCKCIACENKYPLLDELPIVRFRNLETVPDDRISDNSLKKYADYLNKYAKYFPCRQLAFAEGEYQYQLEAIYKEKSMEMRFV